MDDNVTPIDRVRYLAGELARSADERNAVSASIAADAAAGMYDIPAAPTIDPEVLDALADDIAAAMAEPIDPDGSWFAGPVSIAHPREFLGIPLAEIPPGLAARCSAALRHLETVPCHLSRADLLWLAETFSEEPTLPCGHPIAKQTCLVGTSVPCCGVCGEYIEANDE